MLEGNVNYTLLHLGNGKKKMLSKVNPTVKQRSVKTKVFVREVTL
jgi:hypothetical protein